MRRHSVVLLLCLTIAVLGGVVFVWLAGSEAPPPGGAIVKDVEPPGAAKTAQSADLLIRAAAEQVPHGYIVAIDAARGTRLQHFYIDCAGQLTYSSSLGMVRVADLPNGEQVVVGSAGYHDEPLNPDAAKAQERYIVALRPRSCDINVTDPAGQYVYDYSLWAWSNADQVPRLSQCLPSEIRAGMCVYAVHGNDASDIVHISSQSRVSLKLRSGYVSSLRIESSPSTRLRGVEVGVHAVRVHFPTMSACRWLSLDTVELDLPKCDTRVCAVPGQFRIDHERTKESCPGWRDEGRVHVGRIDGNQMPRRWSAIVQEVVLPELQVSDEEGRPLSGVQVRTFFDVRNRGEWRESSYAGMGYPRTDQAGLANWTGGWLLEEISNQGVRVEIAHLGYSSLAVAEPAQRWGSSLGHVVLNRCPEVRIRILRPDGTPFRSEMVRVCAEMRPDEVLAEVSTDEEGTFAIPLDSGTPFLVVCNAGRARGEVRGATTDVTLPAVRQAVIEVPSLAQVELVLVSSGGEIVSQSTASDGLLVFSNLSSTEDYTVVPRDALDQYRSCRFAWAPDIIPGVADCRLPCRPSWLDTPPSRAYVSAPDLPPESILIIPWYGGPTLPLPGGHIPGRRLAVSPDYSVDLGGLHGCPSQLIAILRAPDAGSDWLLARSNDLVTVDCTVRDVILAPSDAWVGGVAMFLGAEHLRWGAVCMTDGVRLTKDQKRIGWVPGLVERVVWRKPGLRTISFDLPPGRGVWRVSSDGVSRVR